MGELLRSLFAGWMQGLREFSSLPDVTQLASIQASVQLESTLPTITGFPSSTGSPGTWSSTKENVDVLHSPLLSPAAPLGHSMNS